MDDFQPGELCAYYRLCRYLGIFCIDYNPNKKRFLLRRSLICYVVHFVLQAYLVGCMAIMVTFWRNSFKRELTTTGNHFDRLVMVVSLGILLLQNAWLIKLQAPHLRIVRQIEFYRRRYLADVQLLLPKRLLWLIIASNLLYTANFIKTCVFDWLSDASQLFVITTLGFPLRYMVTSFTMGTFFCMVHILRLVISWNQSQITDIIKQSGDLKKSSANLIRLRGCLDLHDRVVLLCNNEISLVYGFIAWLSWMFASLDVTGVIYLTMVIQTKKPLCLKLVTDIVWLSPTLMTCAASFLSNRVGIQWGEKAEEPSEFPVVSSWYSVMTLGYDLRLYLQTFKCLGLFCITQEYDSEYRSYASRRDDIISLMGLLISQCLALVALGHVMTKPGQYKLPVYGDVGNTYFLANYGIACLMISLIHLYFYVRRGRLALLISLLLHHNRMDLENRHATEFRRIYAVYVSQVLLTGILQIKSFTHSGFEQSTTVILAAFSTYSYVLLGLIVAFHYCLVRISASLILFYNQDLSKLVDSNLILSGTLCVLRLRQRSRLLCVCTQRISSDFGLVLVLIMAFLLFSAPAAPFFLLTIVFEIDAGGTGLKFLWHALVTTLLWNLPVTVAVLMTLRTDLVRKEVS